MPPATEAGFLRTVLAYARLRGWLCHHSRPAQNRRGRWLTPLAGDAGLPDVLAVRGPRLLGIELKVGRRKPTPAQSLWLSALAAAGAECYCWYPSSWPEIERTLS